MPRRYMLCSKYLSDLSFMYLQSKISAISMINMTRWRFIWIMHHTEIHRFQGGRIATCSEDTTVKIWKSFPPGNNEGIPTQVYRYILSIVQLIKQSYNLKLNTNDFKFYCSSNFRATKSSDVQRRGEDFMTNQEPIQVPKILKSLLWLHLLTDRADFWHGGSILLGLHLKLAIVELGPRHRCQKGHFTATVAAATVQAD